MLETIPDIASDANDAPGAGRKSTFVPNEWHQTAPHIPVAANSKPEGPMLDYRTHTFLTVYRRRSFTAAARELSVTQPAVSQHIRQLEAHYGCTLFRKAGRGVAPTEAADLIFGRLETAENDDRRLAEEVRALADRDLGSTPMRFGCTRTVNDYAAPAILTGHLAAHPRDRIVMRSGNTQELIGAMEQGAIDFALVEGSFDRAAFDSEAISREAYVCVARAGEPPASIRDLLPSTLVVREEGSGTREILERNLHAHDLALEDFLGCLELGSIPSIKACVAAGAGISFIYRRAVEGELADGSLVDITPEDFAIEHDFRLVWQRGSLYAKRYRALAEDWRGFVAGSGGAR